MPLPQYLTSLGLEHLQQHYSNFAVDSDATSLSLKWNQNAL